AFEELPGAVQVAPGRLDMAVRFHDEHSLLHGGVGQDPPYHAGGDHEIIAWPVAERSKLALHETGPLMDENHLVAVSKAVPVPHWLAWPGQPQADILVSHERHPTLHRVASRRERRRAHQTVAKRPRLLIRNLHLPLEEDLVHSSRRPQV